MNRSCETSPGNQSPDLELSRIAAATINILPVAGREEISFSKGGSLLPGAPGISIITPCLNRAQYLDAAVKSVLDQAGPAIEHIIIDGGSTDGSRQILQHYPHLRIVSEPDRNSHHALNKGLSMATGEVIGFLMTDDVIPSGALVAVANMFAQHPEAVAVAGRAFLAQDGQIIAEFVHQSGEDGVWQEVLFGTPAFCSWFFRRSWLEQMNGFDERLVIAADRDILIRTVLAGRQPILLPVPVYIYGLHAGSATLAPGPDQIARQLEEHRTIAAQILETPGLSPVIRDRLRVWHQFETSQAMRHAFRRRHWREALCFAWQWIKMPFC